MATADTAGVVVADGGGGTATIIDPGDDWMVGNFQCDDGNNNQQFNKRKRVSIFHFSDYLIMNMNEI